MCIITTSLRVSLSFSSSIHGHFHFINYTYLTLFEQVVVNLTSPEALCLDTAAFVGVTISFLMLLVIAFITIIFLWLRYVGPPIRRRSRSFTP